MSASIILRRTTLALTSVFAAAGIILALGYVFDDPGGWLAVLLTAAVVVPLVALVVLALGRPELATTVLTGAVVLYAVWTAVTVAFNPVDLPTMPIIALVLAVPIAVVGQRHPWHAGALMMTTAALPFVVILVRFFIEAHPEGDGLGSLFATSTGAVVVPLAILAALFLGAGSSHQPLRGPKEQPPTRPLPPAAMSR